MNNYQVKTKKRKVNGVLLLDKHVGVSSNSALQQVRRLYGAEKAGHTGVLDPLATGLLPICFGEATKFAQYLLDADKVYVATLKLGEATTTGDAEGEVVATSNQLIHKDDVIKAIAAYTGVITQTPPMYAAIKHQGKPLYEYARRGLVLERKTRQVTIFSIELMAFSPSTLTITVHCSKGTYIRTLAEDMAKHMGTVAHLTALRRTETAGFDIQQAHTYAQLASLAAEQRDDLLMPCDALVGHLPSMVLPKEDILRLQHGLTVQCKQNYGTMTTFRVYNVDYFVGLAVYQPEQGYLKSLRLMSTANL